ncbi:MAG: glycosyltransferase family 39 protein [Patescibacteria group bacterium]|nr:glycosyltransferase family 39 protein [Patescibacteria group bacterium]
MSKILNSKFYILTLIIIIAAFLRLYNITELPPGLYPDEAMNGNNALEALSTAPSAGGFKIFYPENNGREGLFINIQAMSVAIFGNEPWALRIVSALFGILTVLGIYFLSKELFKNEKIALLSSFFLTVSFWHINFSRIGFRAIMAPFFLTWAIYFLLKSLNQVKNKFQITNTKLQTISNDQNFNNQNRFGILNFKNWNLFGIWDFGFGISAILAGLFYGLGFHSYIAYRATPLLILIIIALYWFKNKEKEIRHKILLSTFCFLLFTIIVAAPLGLYFLKNPQDFMGRTTQVSVFNSLTPLKDLGTNILKTAGMFNFSGDYNWRHNYAGKPLLFWPVGILFIIGVIISIRRLSSESRILFSWLIIAALPIVVSNEGLPHALRAIIMIPPVFILAGFGGIYIYEKIKNTTIINDSGVRINFLRLIAAVFLIILIIQGYKSYFIDWGKNPNVQGAFAADYVQIGQELNNLPKELPKYVIVEAGGTDVRGIPMPSQTVMFITDTFTPEKQKEKNIFYILPKEKDKIPLNSYTVSLY